MHLLSNQSRQAIRLAVFLSLANTVSICAAEPVDYLKDIKPILAEKCYSCHGAVNQEAGLRLETRPLMLVGGDSGAVLVEGDPTASLILHRVTAADADERMPPAESGSALRPEQIELLKRWIQQGAKTPKEEIPAAPRDHWAFQRIESPPVPKTNPQFANPVDSFLQARREENGLVSNQTAARPILLRRLYLDLIGLPPTLEQLNDSRPWNSIVDELLSSPHHGERWGRHWMDVFRYSDWYGLGAQLRNSQKHMWHWRDWLIESLNDDKGYDRMIHEMLAGDELAPNDLATIRATGFLARNYYLFNRTTWLDDTIEHTGKAFLGLTLNCAKCHNHKYDPITHVDYYNFRAIFEPHQVRLDPVPGEVDFEKDGIPRVFDDHPEIKTQLHRRGDSKNPDPDIPIEAAVPALFSKFSAPVRRIELPRFAWNPGRRDYVVKDRIRQIDSALKTARTTLANAKKSLQDEPESHASHMTGFKIEDDFNSLDPEVWQVIGDGWKHANGRLIQTKSTRDRQLVRLRKQLPRDFEVVCRYTVTGGGTYRSTTFRFDESASGAYDNFVYTSAHAPGPKIQAAYTRNGMAAYPATGRKSFPVEIGTPYALRFAVRNRLVNVWLNDEFQLAYQFPDRQPDGALAISGFDAIVEFESISIRSLPANFKMKSAGPDTTGPKQNVAITTAQIQALTSQREFLEQLAKLDANANASQSLIMQQAKAELEMAEFELLAAGDDAKKTQAAQSKVKNAKQKLVAAQDGKGALVPIRASRKALETPAHKEADYPATYPKYSTGRRLALAKWITSRDNPLTARVAVNHVWMRHFGEPLVESVFDFGLRSKRPKHHELLDFLAAYFIESGWSFKQLHRLIVTSQAYRMTVINSGPSYTLDPTNSLYWRMNTRRMDSQIVRDSLLHLAGQLDARMGGPSVDVGSGTRRSVYFKHSRDQQDKFLSMFDDADHLRCYRRSESIVPQQALALSNSKLSIELAAEIADRISNGMTDQSTRQFVTTAFSTLLAREPNAEELQECLEFEKQILALMPDGNAENPAKIRTRLVQALINHNDFVSIR